MTALAIGTIWFWVVMILGFIVVTYYIEQKESSGWRALITCVIIGLGLYFLGSREPIQKVFQYVVDNPVKMIIVALSYFVFGTAWSMVKWYFFLKKRQRKEGWPTKRVDVKVDNNSFQPGTTTYVPTPLQAKDFRSDILMWMTWWPFSAFWTLINDPIRKAFEWIYDYYEETCNRISQWVFNSTQPKP